MGERNGKVKRMGSIRQCVAGQRLRGVASADQGVVRRLPPRAALYARPGAKMAREVWGQD